METHQEKGAWSLGVSALFPQAFLELLEKRVETTDDHCLIIIGHLFLALLKDCVHFWRNPCSSHLRVLTFHPESGSNWDVSHLFLGVFILIRENWCFCQCTAGRNNISAILITDESLKSFLKLFCLSDSASQMWICAGFTGYFPLEMLTLGNWDGHFTLN